MISNLQETTSESKLYIPVFVRIRTTYFGAISEWKLYICSQFPNESYILSEWKLYIWSELNKNFQMKATYFFGTSEWKLYICPNESYIFCLIPSKTVEISWGKKADFCGFRNESYIYFHSFRMKAIYFSTASEWKLYIFLRPLTKTTTSSGEQRCDYNM